MNEYFDLVDRIKFREGRYQVLVAISGPGRPRDKRGTPLPPERLEAVIWGVSHPSPVVRRCCLELLDQHPDPSAIPHIVAALDDPVPRVRWHAVHALHCDVCKAGQTFMSPDIVDHLRRVAEHDGSEKVRSYTSWVLAEAGLANNPE